MNLGKPLVKYQPTKFSELRKKVLGQPTTFWSIDLTSRIKLAGNRPGNAVFFYNDKPPCVNRPPLLEAKSGIVSVLRYKDRPLFPEIQQLIETEIMPFFPDCDILRVQLAELPPGQAILPHTDTGILALIHRLHIPIITHAHVQFVIAGQAFFLEEGVLYDLNNTVIHSVVNKSNIMRIHLLVDMIPHSVATARYYNSEDAMVAACNK